MPKTSINLLITPKTLKKIQELYKKRYPDHERSFSSFIEETLVFYITEREAQT
ncbi:MAG TPA: hypothetical protein PKI66_02730 [Methanobacteriaceae archaeon]|nr:hypothetical protein [Methanobacteriaceae archaeon]